MKVGGWLIAGILAIALVGTGCSRTDMSVVARVGEDAEENGAIVVTAAETALDYLEDELRAPAGEEFVVNFDNPSATEHNWVLVEPGQEQGVAEAAGQQGGEAEGLDGVIQATPIITNDSADVIVSALDAGEYPYICTVPGHYAAGMEGTLIVE